MPTGRAASVQGPEDPIPFHPHQARAGRKVPASRLGTGSEWQPPAPLLRPRASRGLTLWSRGGLCAQPGRGARGLLFEGGHPRALAPGSLNCSGILGHLGWTDIGEPAQTAKPLSHTFLLRRQGSCQFSGVFSDVLNTSGPSTGGPRPPLAPGLTHQGCEWDGSGHSSAAGTPELKGPVNLYLPGKEGQGHSLRLHSPQAMGHAQLKDVGLFSGPRGRQVDPLSLEKPGLQWPQGHARSRVGSVMEAKAVGHTRLAHVTPKTRQFGKKRHILLLVIHAESFNHSEKKNLQNPDYILKLDKIFFQPLLDSII